MAFDLKSVIASVAPTLATMLGGPLAGTAITALEGAFGLAPGAGMGAITQIVQTGGMTPEIISSVRAADQKHAEVVSQQGIDLQKLNLAHDEAMAATAEQDRVSARTREVSVRDNTPKVLTYLYTVALFAVIGVEFAIGIKQIPIDPLVKSTLDTLFGVLLTMVIGSKEYYLGTSSSDAHKTELLAKSTPPGGG
jgi:hypothetical protein